jgi:ligand-binding sensor domain-containing protein
VRGMRTATTLLAGLLCLVWLMVAPHAVAAAQTHPSSASGDASVEAGGALWTHWQLFTVVRSLAADGDSIWVGTDNGLMRFYPKTEEKSVYGTSNGLLSSVVLFVKVAPDGRARQFPPGRQSDGGQVWVGTAGGGLSRFDGSQWTFYTPYGYGSSLQYDASWTRWPHDRGIGDLWVYNVAFDPHGTMWAATWKGLSRFDGSGFHTFTVADGLVDKWVYTLAIDRNGRIWAGTEGGVTRYDPRPAATRAARWVSWTNHDGVGAPAPPVAPESAEASYDTGTAAVGRHHTPGGPKDVSRRVNPNYISSSLFDRQGRLWVGTMGGGLARFDGKRWTSYTTKEGLSGDVVYAMTLDEKRNVLWIGTNEGVTRYDFKTFTNFRKDDGLFAGAVYAVAVDPAGDKWFGSYGQVSRYRGK